MIRVLIADDSATARELLSEILGGDPDIDVIGVVKDGAEALAFIRETRPDVITMDINMPRMNGFDATRRIMETNPLPVVIVSGLSLDEQRASFPAVEAGALAVVPRPPGPEHRDFSEGARELISTVKAMSEVRVVRRWPRGRVVEEPSKTEPVSHRSSVRGIRIVGIGASTGGPAALRTILSRLGPDFPLPVIVVQHMSYGFIDGFVEWLKETTGMPVQLARDDGLLEAGHVYVAPEGAQTGVSREGKVRLSRPGEESTHWPSISWLIQSLAEAFGPEAAGVLLTGMGRDGADSMKFLKDRGGLTIVQDVASSVVHGMPAEAIKLNAADYILPPERIASLLRELATGEGTLSED